MATSRDQAQNIVFTKQPFVKDVGPRKIKSMQFRVQSASEISKMAEVQVGKGHYYDSNCKISKMVYWIPACTWHREGFLKREREEIIIIKREALCPRDLAMSDLHFKTIGKSKVNSLLVLSFIQEETSLKSCSRILLEDTLRKDYMKKTISSKTEPLKKFELMKKIVKKCNSKAVKCSECGYMNGSVKKCVSILGIIHDCSKLNDGPDELRSAISYIKESRASPHFSSHSLNPATVVPF